MTSMTILGLVQIVCAVWIAAVGLWLRAVGRRLSELDPPDASAGPSMGCYRTAAERYEAESDQRPKLPAFRSPKDPCPKCYARHQCKTYYCTSTCGSGRETGVQSPTHCDGCKRDQRPHLHVSCASCGARWLMATADAGGAS